MFIKHYRFKETRSFGNNVKARLPSGNRRKQGNSLAKKTNKQKNNTNKKEKYLTHIT